MRGDFVGHYVYKYVYNNEIIYIGKNDTDLETRINQHKLEEKFIPYLKSDICYIELANSIMSDVVESELIRRYKPKLNVAKMSDWSGLDFVEPEWKVFNYTKKKKSNRTAKHAQTKISNKKKTRIMICKLMSQYYCSYILNNLSKIIEDDKNYKIEIPLSKDDNEYEYCVPPYINIHNEKGCGFLSLGHCEFDEENVTFVFNKECIFREFYGIELGLVSRIKHMKNMFSKELEGLQSCQ